MMVVIPGLAMNGVRRSENGCSCSVFCSAFGSERVRHFVRLLFVFGVRVLLCSCSCSDRLFMFSSVFGSHSHADVAFTRYSNGGLPC